MLAGLLMLPAGPARAQTTYDVGLAQIFFDQGAPGFSARFYPGSIKVHEGDMIRFDLEPEALLPGGDYPQELMGEAGEIGHPRNPFIWDPDDGEKALKANFDFFFGGEGDTCGRSEADPCIWGPGDQPIFPVFAEEPPFELLTRVDAPAGTTLWASSIMGSDVNVNFKVQVVPNNEEASTQEALDARAESLRQKDFENALALHNKMKSKKTFHINAAGKKVWDVFVGVSAGPITLFASYPRKTVIPRRARVQFHFMDQIEPHTATFGGPNARDVLFNFLIAACDPDGDEGPGPDVDPIDFDPETGLPICPEGTELEGDIHDLLPWAVGDGKVTKNSDYQNSGILTPRFPDGNAFDENPDPMTVRFPKTTNKKGLRFICLIHGPEMGGRVRVK